MVLLVNFWKITCLAPQLWNLAEIVLGKFKSGKFYIWSLYYSYMARIYPWNKFVKLAEYTLHFQQMAQLVLVLII